MSARVSTSPTSLSRAASRRACSRATARAAAGAALLGRGLDQRVSARSLITARNRSTNSARNGIRGEGVGVAGRLPRRPRPRRYRKHRIRTATRTLARRRTRTAITRASE